MKQRQKEHILEMEGQRWFFRYFLKKNYSVMYFRKKKFKKKKKKACDTRISGEKINQ